MRKYMQKYVIALVLCVPISVLGGCSGVGSYAKSLGISDPFQLEGATADYVVALKGFLIAGLLTDAEAKMEYDSEVLRLNEGTKSNLWLKAYRREAVRENPRFVSYQPKCSWVGL